MAESLKPHVTYLDHIYTGVLTAANVPHPSFITEEDGKLAPQFEGVDLTSFNDYFEYLGRETSYFVDCFDTYGSLFDHRLHTNPANKHMTSRGKRGYMWILSVVAYAETRVSQPEGAKGVLVEDIKQLSVPNLLDPRSEGAYTTLGVVEWLGRLEAQGLLFLNDDPSLKWLDHKGVERSHQRLGVDDCVGGSGGRQSGGRRRGLFGYAAPKRLRLA